MKREPMNLLSTVVLGRNGRALAPNLAGVEDDANAYALLEKYITLGCNQKTIHDQ